MLPRPAAARYAQQFASPKGLDHHRLHLDLARAREVLEADHALASSRSGDSGTPPQGSSRGWREAALETSALATRLRKVLAALEAKQGSGGSAQ